MEKKNILFCTDFSEHANTAFDHAIYTVFVPRIRFLVSGYQVSGKSEEIAYPRVKTSFEITVLPLRH